MSTHHRRLDRLESQMHAKPSDHPAPAQRAWLASLTIEELELGAEGARLVALDMPESEILATIGPDRYAKLCRLFADGETFMQEWLATP